MMQAGITLGAQAEIELAIDSVLAFWAKKGIPIDGLSLNDGSGASHYNAVNALQLVSLLKYMKTKSEKTEVFYQSLPLAGESGTIQNMFKGTAAQHNLRAKSGTIDNGKAYAGYVKSKSGREIAFAVIVNNFTGSSSIAKAQLEQLLIALANYNQ